MESVPIPAFGRIALYFHEKITGMKNILLLVLLLGGALLARSQSVGDVVKQQAGEGVKTGTAVATEQTATSATNKLLNKFFNKKPKSGKVDSAKSVDRKSVV